MIPALRLAGSLAALAIHTIAQDPDLLPYIGYLDGEGNTDVTVLAAPGSAPNLEAGRAELDENRHNAQAAAFVFDGRITLDNSSRDAVILEVRDYASPEARVTIAVPYRPASRRKFLKIGRQFTIFRPIISQFDGCDELEQSAAFAAFLEGVHANPIAGETWWSAYDTTQ